MTGKVQKWGNSLAIRIPKAFAEGVHVAEGSPVDISVKDDTIEIRPLKRPRFDLADLLSKVTPQNLHGETDFGGPVGRESL